MKVQPVNFNQEHKEMLGHCKMLLERGYITINLAFDKLITALSTAVAEENILDKESTSYADIFDAKLRKRLQKQVMIQEYLY
jgi:hypothetical protein